MVGGEEDEVGAGTRRHGSSRWWRHAKEEDEATPMTRMWRLEGLRRRRTLTMAPRRLRRRRTWAAVHGEPPTKAAGCEARNAHERQAIYGLGVRARHRHQGGASNVSAWRMCACIAVAEATRWGLGGGERDC